MTLYLKALVAVCFCGALILSVVPKEGAGKYAEFAVGLMVISVMLLPVFRWTGISLPSFASLEIKEVDRLHADYLQDTFSEQLEETIKQYVLETEGISVSVTVVPQVEENGTVTGVAQVTLTPYAKPLAQKLAAYLQIPEERVIEHGGGT